MTEWISYIDWYSHIDYLLAAGSLTLLLIGLLLYDSFKARHRSTGNSDAPTAMNPDLRWWRNA